MVSVFINKSTCGVYRFKWVKTAQESEFKTFKTFFLQWTKTNNKNCIKVCISEPLDGQNRNPGHVIWSHGLAQLKTNKIGPIIIFITNGGELRLSLNQKKGTFYPQCTALGDSWRGRSPGEVTSHFDDVYSLK